MDPLSVYVWNPKTEQREKKTMYCAIVVPYRVRIVIPASEMWEEGEERPDYVLQNMVGATVDLIIIKVEREGGFAIGSAGLPIAASGISLPTGRICTASEPASSAGCWLLAPGDALWTATATILISPSERCAMRLSQTCAMNTTPAWRSTAS